MTASRPEGRWVIDVRLTARAIGGLLLTLSAAMLLPAAWSLALGSGEWQAFLWSGLLVGLPSAALARLPAGGPMRSREALLVVTLGWVASAAAATLPFLFTGSLPGFVDALFETMSGLTTTGATVLTAIESHPPGILYWRSLLHWLGGLGIIVIFLAILPQVGLGGTHLFQAEVPGPHKQRLRPKLRETARVLLWVYLALSGLQMVALKLAGMSPFEAQIHTFGTMGTGGFSSRTASIAAFDSPLIEAIIVVFMLAAGTNFALYYRAVLNREGKVFLKDPEFRWYIALLAGAALIVISSIAGKVGPVEAVRQGVFQVVSIMTTTGFTTADFDRWPEAARLMLVLLMFVGACAGSTGGAIKVIRLVVLAKHLYRELLQTVHPAAVLPVSLGGEPVPERTIRQVTGFVGLYLACFLAATLYLSSLGLDLGCAGSAVAATLGNIGPGLGTVGPALDYTQVPASGKAVLTLMMLLGRLELFTVLAVLTPAFWRR